MLDVRENSRAALKLLFILPEYRREPAGGIRTFYCNLLPALAATGCQVEVLVAHRDRFDAPSFTDVRGVKVEYLCSAIFEKHSRSVAASYMAGYPALGHFVPMGLAAYEQARAGEGYDLVELTDWPFYFLPWVCRGSRAPFTISLHSSMGQMRSFEALAGWEMEAQFIRLVEAAAFTAAPSVHTNSNLNAMYWEGIIHRKMDVLLPVIAGSMEQGAGSSEQLPSTRDSLRATSRKRGAVFARLQNWKGAELLCEALRLVPEVSVDWYGRPVAGAGGKGNYDEDLREKFPDIFGRQLLHRGEVGHEEAQQAMGMASFVCVPSLWDVFNLTVIEAMQQGSIVICSLQAGAEMLIEDGRNGFLFDPDSPASLAAVLRNVSCLGTTRREEIARAAKQTIEGCFERSALVAARTAYYTQAATNGPWGGGNAVLASVCNFPEAPPPKKRSLLVKVASALREGRSR